jgi:hypothetical protein
LERRKTERLQPVKQYFLFSENEEKNNKNAADKRDTETHD